MSTTKKARQVTAPLRDAVVSVTVAGSTVTLADTFSTVVAPRETQDRLAAAKIRPAGHVFTTEQAAWRILTETGDNPLDYLEPDEIAALTDEARAELADPTWLHKVGARIPRPGPAGQLPDAIVLAHSACGTEPITLPLARGRHAVREQLTDGSWKPTGEIKANTYATFAGSVVTDGGKVLTAFGRVSLVPGTPQLAVRCKIS